MSTSNKSTHRCAICSVEYLNGTLHYCPNISYSPITPTQPEKKMETTLRNLVTYDGRTITYETRGDEHRLRAISGGVGFSSRWESINHKVALFFWGDEVGGDMICFIFSKQNEDLRYNILHRTDTGKNVADRKAQEEKELVAKIRADKQKRIDKLEEQYGKADAKTLATLHRKVAKIRDEN